MSPSLRALVVDDEVLARVALRQALAPHRDVEVVGECGDAAEALASIPLVKPDLLFLDVRMPEMDGFELLQAAGLERRAAVVFVTAFGEHALRAFEAEATDYLLKPLDQDRVDRALVKVRAALGRPAAPGPFALRLAGRSRDGVRLLRVEEVDYVAAEGNYVTLHAGSESYLRRETLAALQARLDPARFVRIHRRTLVNLDCIREIRPLAYGDARVLLRTGVELAVSRRCRDRLRALLDA